MQICANTLLLRAVTLAKNSKPKYFCFCFPFTHSLSTLAPTYRISFVAAKGLFGRTFRRRRWGRGKRQEGARAKPRRQTSLEVAGAHEPCQYMPGQSPLSADDRCKVLTFFSFFFRYFWARGAAFFRWSCQFCAGVQYRIARRTALSRFDQAAAFGPT